MQAKHSDGRKTHDSPGEVIFLRDIPTELKCAFKAFCAKRRKSMKEVLVEAMMESVKQDGVIV